MDEANSDRTIIDSSNQNPANGNGVSPDRPAHGPNSVATKALVQQPETDETSSKARTVRLRPSWMPNASPTDDLTIPVSMEDTFATPPFETESPDPVRNVGPYQIHGILAQGGMGVIYRALDTRLKRQVALKMILSGAHACSATLARFRGEAEAVARLQHTNIVQIFEVGDHQGLPFLALEFVDGTSLAQVLAQKSISPRQAAETVRTLALAVDFAHQRGIIHRDLKPGNILITKQGVPKITDFGLAKLKGATETFSRPGEVIGTPNYMAPEQAEGDPNLVGPVADVYSLGAVLYELLTNQPPFQGGSPMETLMRLRVNDVVRPSHYQPKVPRDLETICLKCLEKERHRRYPSAAELAEDLSRFLEGRAIAARPVGPAERIVKWSRRHPTIAFVTFAMLTSVLVSNAAIIAQWQDVRAAHAEIGRRSQELARAQADIEREQAAAKDAQLLADRAILRADQFDYLAKLNQAEREFATGDAAKAVDLLEQCNPRLRSWEWRYLRRRVEGSALTLTLHPGELAGLRFMPDNRTVATLTGDGRLAIRQGDSGQVLRQVRLKRGQRVPESAQLTKGTFSPSADRVAAVCFVANSLGKPVRGIAIWDTATGELRHAWELPVGEPLQIVFRADGKRLAATIGHWSTHHGQGEWRGDRVEVFAIDTGKILWDREVAPDEPSYLDVCFVPGSTRLALTRRGIAFAFWDAETGKSLREFKSPDFYGHGVSVDPKGETFAIRDGDHVTLFDANGNRIANLNGHTGMVTQHKFSADGRQLLTCGADHIIRVWQLASNRTSAVLVGHLSSVTMSDLSADGKRVASVGANGELKIWDLASDDPPALFTNSGHEWTPGIAFIPGTKWLASGSGDGRLVVWDLATGASLRTIQCPAGISCLAASPDGAKLAVGYDGHGGAAYWDPRSGKQLGDIPIAQPVNGIAFSPDGRHLLTVGDGGLAEVWNAETRGQETKFTGHAVEVTSGAYSPDGKLVATGDENGIVHLWDPITGRIAASIRAHASAASCLAFSPDGQTLATANAIRERPGLPVQIRIWNVATGDKFFEMAGHDLSVWCLAFTPDGNRLMSGSEDKTIKIWDTRRGQLLLTLKGHTDDVRSLAFSRDGNVLVSSNDDNWIRFWDATPIEEGAGIQAQFMNRP